MRISIALLVSVLLFCMVLGSIAVTELYWNREHSLTHSDFALDDVVQLPCYVLRKVGSGDSAIYQMVYKTGCKSGGGGSAHW